MARCLLARIKSFLARHMLVIEFCDDCGIEQPLVWWCEDDAVWREVANGAGTLCPECFDKRATKLGFFIRWYAREQHPRLAAEPAAE